MSTHAPLLCRASMRVAASLLAAFVACCAAPGGSTAQAAITSSGDISPVPPAAGGAVAGQFNIGNVDVGTMTINTSGGPSPLISTQNAVLGGTVTGIGIVNMSGFGSDWTLTTSTGDMIVGQSGAGSLNLSNLAFVSVADDLFVAGQLNSLGEISISGFGTIFDVGDDANIGQRSQAIINVSNGGRLVTDQNIIGDEAAGDGRVTLSGDFSMWRATSTITVADAGRAHLQILDGARVENTGGVVAQQAGSNGTVEVAGPGSLWQNSLNLIIGEFGHGTLLVRDGGRVVNGVGVNAFVVGRQVGSVGEVEVRGRDSLINVSVIDVGETGTGTLRILEGGRVNSSAAVLGDNAASRGIGVVDGNGSLWDVFGTLDVGNFGEAHLTISNGGLVRTVSNSRVAALGRLTLDDGRIRIQPLTFQNTGVVDGNGTIEVPTTNNNPGGRIRPRGDEPLRFTGTLNNAGLIDVEAAILEVAGPTNNNLDIDARNGAILRFGGIGLDNNSGAQLAITAGNVDVFGLVNNDLGAEIVVGGTAVAVFHDAATNNGTIFVQPGGKVLMLENLAFTSAAALSLPLAGPGEIGQIDVAAPATLDGNLDVPLAGGFVPAPGDQFTVLSSVGLSGSFDNVTTTPGAPVQFHAIYTPTQAKVIVAGAGDKTWGIDASGDASVAGNWLGGVAPGGVGDKVAFTTIITKDATVTADAPFTAGSLYFDDDNNYLLDGRTITLDVTTGTARIDVKSLHGNGTHTIAAPLALNDNTTIDVARGSTLNITSQMTAASGVTITKNGPGLLAVRNVRASALAINSGTVRVLPDGGPGATTVLKSLTIGPAERLDLTNNALVLDYDGPASPLSEVRSQIISAFAGGSWTGNGITSSSAASSTRAIGYGESSSILGPSGGIFAGQSVDGTAVLVRFTIKGDANLDGVVGFPDLVALAQNYNGTDKLWNQGDFNYDGNVGFPDLVALAQNYNSALPTTPIPGAGAAFQQDLAAAMAQVPEPTQTTAVALVACLLARRSRDKVVRKVLV